MKTPEKYPEEVYEFVKEILYRYKDRVETIILFGSVARGEAREESDIDILVVGDVDLDELVEVSFPLLLKYGKLISAKDMKKSSFKKQTKEGYSFINNVLNDGVILYERVGKADYDVFYVPSRDESKSLLEDAAKFLNRINRAVIEINNL